MAESSSMIAGLPFVGETVSNFKNVWQHKRTFAFQVLNLGLTVVSALMIWKSLILITGSESPVVVVLSGSMEPAMQRGDILVLDNPNTPIEMGEIVVFQIKGKDIPIVHRVLEIRNRTDGTVDYLTKGDNNSVNDRSLYNIGQLWINKSDIIGRVRGYLPCIGIVTILLNDYPLAKYVVVGIMGLYVITTKEQ